MKIQIFKNLYKQINESETTMNKDRLLVYAFILTNLYRLYNGNAFELTTKRMRHFFNDDALKYKEFFMNDGVLTQRHQIYNGPIFYIIKPSEYVSIKITSKTAINVYKKYISKVFGKTPFKFDKKAEVVILDKTPIIEKPKIEGEYLHISNEDFDQLSADFEASFVTIEDPTVIKSEDTENIEDNIELEEPVSSSIVEEVKEEEDKDDMDSIYEEMCALKTGDISNQAYTDYLNKQFVYNNQ